MAEREKTRFEAVRDRLSSRSTQPTTTRTQPRPSVRTGPRIPPPRAAPPPTPPAASGGRALVPSGGRALTTPGTAVDRPRVGGGPRVPPLNTIGAAGGGGSTAARVGSAAVRAAGRFSGAASAATPTDVGNAENTPEAAGLQQRFDEFQRLQAQGGAVNQDGTPVTFEETENLFAQKQEFDRKQAVQRGLRGRAGAPGARGQGFIQNEETGTSIDFGVNDPEGERLDSEAAVRTTPSSGIRERSRASRKSGNAFADIALGFGDATRAAIQEGRGQANRARQQRLRESAITNLPKAQKEARLAEQDRIKGLEADAEQADKFRTDFDSAPTDESKRAVQREAQADLAANGPNSPGGRFAIGQALDAVSQESGGLINAIFGERGPFDFVKSIVEGFPDGEFSSAAGLFLSKDGDIMQDVGGGDFTVVIGLDELGAFERDTLTQVLTLSPEDQ